MRFPRRGQQRVWDLADRRTGTLRVKAVHREPGRDLPADALEAAVASLAVFLGADQVVLS